MSQGSDGCPAWCVETHDVGVEDVTMGSSNLSRHTSRTHLTRLPEVATGTSTRDRALWELWAEQYVPPTDDDQHIGPVMIVFGHFTADEITTGEARTLAAQLVALADLADGIR